MSRQNLAAPRMVGVGAVFIDDIVLPTGKTYMGELGGGVVHAMMGAAVWGERPGLNAVIGRGLPESSLHHLENNLDTSGLIHLDIPQIRAWQLFEEDGTRRELYRVHEIEPFITGAQPHQLPDHYHQAQSFYLLQSVNGIRAWCSTIQGIILWEPLQQIMTPDTRALIRSVLQDYPISVISPNLVEAQAVYGDRPPRELLNELFADGAQIAVLRMGEQGSLVGQRESGQCWHIPAVEVNQVIDQTGAGNTYCGGFLLGLVDGKSLNEAGVMGAVSASFCLETVGVIDPIQIDTSKRDERYTACMVALRSG
jgi:cytidine kinase